MSEDKHLDELEGNLARAVAALAALRKSVGAPSADDAALDALRTEVTELCEAHCRRLVTQYAAWVSTHGSYPHALAVPARFWPVCVPASNGQMAMFHGWPVVALDVTEPTLLVDVHEAL